jgi:hypothetical protein
MVPRSVENLHKIVSVLNVYTMSTLFPSAQKFQLRSSWFLIPHSSMTVSLNERHDGTLKYATTAPSKSLALHYSKPSRISYNANILQLEQRR